VSSLQYCERKSEAAARGIQKGASQTEPLGSVAPAPPTSDVNIYGWPPAVAVVGPISIRHRDRVRRIRLTKAIACQPVE
jgi:hypothetical protein